MEIKGGKIVKATDIELYEYWLKSGWSDIYSYTEYKNKVKELGTKVVEDDRDWPYVLGNDMFSINLYNHR